MNNLATLPVLPSLFVNRDETSTKNSGEKKVVSFYKNSVKYSNLPLEEKWKYRKAVNSLQVLINKIQSEEITELEKCDLNLPEIVTLLKVRKEMLTSK